MVFWRLRYKLSLRDLSEMFLIRGIEFSYEAVRDWQAKLTSALIDDLRRRRLEHDVFYRNRDSQLGEFLIQAPCWGTGASMDDTTLFGRHSRTGSCAG